MSVPGGERVSWWRAGAVVVVGALLAAACGDDGGGADGASGGADDPRWEHVQIGPEESDAEPVQGGSIVVALEDDPGTLLPSTYRASIAGQNVAYALYDPLVTRDAEGEIRPYLAESVEPNDDFTEWTVKLRPDVSFHDGTTLDAEVLKRIWDDHLTAEGAITQQITRFVERMEVVDELTVTYVLTEPHARFSDWLELPLGWPFSPDAADRLGDDYDDEPVGTGPYRFVSWQRDGDLVVERNDDYWQDGLPYLDEITFRAIPDESTRAASLTSGDVDAIQSSSLSSLAADLAGLGDVEVMLGLGNRGGAVLFNTAEPPADDVRIRQALAHAVDQEAIIQVAADAAAELTEPRTQFFPSDSPYYSEAVADAWLDYDPERAQDLYQEYIDDPDRSDGKDVGEPVSIAFNTLNTPDAVEIATAYEGAYDAVGFDATVNQLDDSTLAAERLGGSYQVMYWRLGGDRSPLGEFIYYFDSPDLITNMTNFHDEQVEQVIEGLRRTGDVEEQAALVEELGLHLAEQVPLQWTATSLTLIAAAPDVQGLRSWTFPDGSLGDGVLPSVAFWSQVWLDR